MIILASCDNGPVRSFYNLVLPDLPAHWEEILGEPHWRIEWVGGSGSWKAKEIFPGEKAPGISLIQEWVTPVLAWPFWPDRNLVPGTMQPSGALFPWDVSGRKLNLGWKGGVDAVFWKEIAASERVVTASDGRLPWYFDWMRFRELLESDNIPEAVRQDPWLADWRSIAQKTVQSGFDRRRIVSRSFTELSIPGFVGRWIGSSPFALPLEAESDCSLYIKASDSPDTWVSAEGILKCSVSGYVFIPK